jgi:hypothetical protein
MQRDDKRIIHSVEIVNVPPAKDELLDKVDLSSGTTELDKKDLQRLFQGRNLAFLSTLSKDGSPHITPVWADMEDDLVLVNTFETSAKKIRM